MNKTSEEIGEEWEKFSTSNDVVTISQLLGKVAPPVYAVISSITEPKKTSNPSQDWSMCLTLADPTLPPPNRGLSILIFKGQIQDFPPYKVGSIVKCVLKIQTYQSRLQGVFPRNPRKPQYLQILIMGDPSLSMVDSKFFSKLKQWWDTLVNNPQLNISLAPKKNFRRPTITVRDINQDTKYFDIFLKVIYVVPKKGSDDDFSLSQTEQSQSVSQITKKELIVTDFTRNDTFQDTYPVRLNPELGITDIDANYLMSLTLWDKHASLDIAESSYLYVTNARVKPDEDSRLEMCVHGDKVYPGKQLVFIRDHGNLGNDEPLIELLQREKNYSPGQDFPVAEVSDSNQCANVSNSQSQGCGNGPPQTAIITRDPIPDLQEGLNPIIDNLSPPAGLDHDFCPEKDSPTSVTTNLSQRSLHRYENKINQEQGGMDCRDNPPLVAKPSPDKTDTAKYLIDIRSLAAEKCRPVLKEVTPTVSIPQPTVKSLANQKSACRSYDGIHSIADIKETSKYDQKAFKTTAKALDCKPFTGVEDFTSQACTNCETTPIFDGQDCCTVPNRHFVYSFAIILQDENGDKLPVIVEGDAACKIMKKGPSSDCQKNAENIRSAFHNVIQFGPGGGTRAERVVSGEFVVWEIFAFLATKRNFEGEEKTSMTFKLISFSL